METIIFHDLSNLCSEGRKSKLKENQFSLYVNVNENGKSGTHNLNFGGLRNEYDSGYTHMNVAENTLTGEVFLVFSKNKGVELGILKGGNHKRKNDSDNRGRVGTQKNNVVQFLCKILNLDATKSLNTIFNLSSNLSKSEDNVTFKILVK